MQNKSLHPIIRQDNLLSCILYKCMVKFHFCNTCQGDVDSISNCLDYKQGANTLGKRGVKWLIANNINFEKGG